MTKKCDEVARRPLHQILASFARPLLGAEVGVACGENAALLLSGVPIERLWLIDPWGQYVQDGYHWDFEPHYQDVVNRFAADSRVTILREESLEASKRFEPRSLDFVYIDACHEKASVAQDIAAWMDKVRVGGILAGHDFAWRWPGVVRAVLQAASDGDWDLQTRTPEWWTVKEFNDG